MMGEEGHAMKARRHTPEQVIRKLREATGCWLRGRRSRRSVGTWGSPSPEPTYHRWRTQFGGTKADDVKRLRELERENARLKRIVADQALNIDALEEVARGRMKVKFTPSCWRGGVVGGASR
jgi:hypothetical protein